MDSAPGAVRTERWGRSGSTSAIEEEIEGVFVVRDEKAIFVPVTTGIAGEKYFEVLEGLQEGDQVVTGNFAALRKLKDGDSVKLDKKDKKEDQDS